MSRFTSETPPSLTDEQIALVEAPIQTKIFLEGPAGAGKTTTGVERLLSAGCGVVMTRPPGRNR